MPKIRLGIVGYGNVGRGVEHAIGQNKDMELVAIFTRRKPGDITPVTAGVKVYNVEDAERHLHAIDVMLLCGGSANDLMVQAPHFAAMFNCVDSFDTHAKIPEYFAMLDESAKKSKKISIISTGWDPGLFSLLRVLGMACIPNGCDYTFWGKGVSQGHSDAIRRINGVKYAVQYTIPMDCALAEVRKGNNPALSTCQKHIRECFVVADPQADLRLIEQTIKAMPHYFCDYETIVHFISEKEFEDEHTNMPHGGFVFRTGTTGKENAHQQRMEFSLQLDSNPEFTAGVMVAYARAAHRLYLKGETGAKTVLDIPLGLLVIESMEELRKVVV
ncbi:MAG: diaminopimelate dehydrogenase [Bacteroidetes bacterium]|nr:diaminopimelate dehydrogenase [Bacteroidota bacterium]MCL2302072.1 diaminopimelate dehydrogenase [Lentimicrobiaceae bacterium]